MPVADPGHTPGAGRGTATILRYEPDVVEFGIDAERAGLLVASEIFAPGWRAFVDGGERAIWRANGAFRGVEIPAGRHRLRFEYRAPGYAAGRALSVTAAVGLLAAFLLAGIRRRRAGVSVSG